MRTIFKNIYALLHIGALVDRVRRLEALIDGEDEGSPQSISTSRAPVLTELPF